MSADPDDLLSKADALMARHGHARPAAAKYAEIPVLDEVVDAPPERDDLPLLTEFVVLPPPDEKQIEALAADIRAALLADLQGSLDDLIDARLKDSLAPLVETLFNELRSDLQLVARETLAGAIRDALERELARRR